MDPILLLIGFGKTREELLSRIFEANPGRTKIARRSDALWGTYTGATLPKTIVDGRQTTDSRTPRVAYLLSRYPAISHTFFLKEVLGLRQRGMTVFVASINHPDRARSALPEIEAGEADQTFYVKPNGMSEALVRLGSILLSNPRAALRGLRAASRLGGWDLKSRFFALFYLAEALLVGDWMRGQSLQHLHVHFGGPVATVGMLTSQAWQIPWSVTLHGPDEFFDQDAFYLPQKIESASFVVCISDFCRSQVLRIAASMDDRRLETVRLGVDCSDLQPAEMLLDQALLDGSHGKSKALLIVCTGRMVPAKGHRILIEAVASLLTQGVDLNCMLIGDGPERVALEALTRNHGIADKVQFLGALAHEVTLAQVAQADIFVLASFAEGLPVALMEAMALGVPCVSTTIAAIPELIDSWRNGVLVAPANVQALVAALSTLLGDAQLRKTMGQAARQTVELNYNLARNLDLLSEVWKRRLLSQS